MKKLFGIVFVTLILNVVFYVSAFSAEYKYEALVVTQAEVFDHIHYSTGEAVPLGEYIQAGEVVEVFSDLTSNGEVYCAVEYDESNSYHEYVKLSSLQLITPAVGIEAAHKETPKKAFVINKEGMKLRSGPALGFPELKKTIKFETAVKYEYVSKDSNWAYVKYKGEKGWLHISEMGRGFDESSPFTGEITVRSDRCVVTETVDPDSPEIDIKIPVGTVLKAKCYYGVDKHYYVSDERRYFIKYGSVKGWVSCKGISEGVRGAVYVPDDTVTVFSEPDCKSEIQLDIPVGTILMVDETDGYLYRVNYNNKDVWIHIMNPDAFCYSDIMRDYKVIAPEGIKVYEKPETYSKVISTIEKDEIISGYELFFDCSDDWSYIELNGVGGWISPVYNTNVEFVDGTERHFDDIFGKKIVEAPRADKIVTSETSKTDISQDKNTAPINFEVLVPSFIIILAMVAVIAIVIKKKKR